jgi:hypothetical protein
MAARLSRLSLEKDSLGVISRNIRYKCISYAGPLIFQLMLRPIRNGFSLFISKLARKDES